jgi:glycine oxidase
VVHGHATIIPQGDGFYRVGSTYQWSFENDEIEKVQVDFLTSGLEKTVRCDFNVLNALAGIRPTTADRRPIVGCINTEKSHYTLNGLGTKGYSLAPYFADMLVNHLVDGSPILNEVEYHRFTKK